MISYIIRRLILAIPTVILVTLFTFIMIHLVPGDVVDLMTGTQNYLTQEQLRELYRSLGLDKPLMIQYFSWIYNLLKMDMGISLRTGEKVLKMILERIPVTFELAVFSITIAVLIGIPLGMLSGVRRGSKVDIIARIFGLAGLSAPTFWVGAILIVLVSRAFPKFKIFGYTPFFENPISNLSSILLPSLTLGLLISSQVMRITRASVVEILGQEFIKVARSKGLPEKMVVWKHVFRNSAIPVLTTAGIQFGYLLGGTVVIENIFSIPGIGRLVFEAVSKRDYPTVLGSVLFITATIVILNIIVDVIYTFVDPRVRLE